MSDDTRRAVIGVERLDGDDDITFQSVAQAIGNAVSGYFEVTVVPADVLELDEDKVSNAPEEQVSEVKDALSTDSE